MTAVVHLAPPELQDFHRGTVCCGVRITSDLRITVHPAVATCPGTATPAPPPTRRKPATSAPAMSEEDWYGQVLELAHLHGWMVAHFRAARTADGWRTPVAADGKGFPDLVLAHRAFGILIVELKRDGENPRPEQEVWLDQLRAAGARAEVWRPADADRVTRLLAGERRTW